MQIQINYRKLYEEETGKQFSTKNKDDYIKWVETKLFMLENTIVDSLQNCIYTN